MSDHERGAYTPPHDEPLAFDARSPQSKRPLPLTLIASAVVLLILIVAIFLFYQSGVREADQAPRVVGDPVDTLKTEPAEEARPIDESRLDVYVDDGTEGTAADPTFAPPPEQPQPRPQPQATTPAPTAPVPAPKATAPAATTTAPTTPTPAPAQPAPAPVAKAEPALRPAQTGGAAVQIGAFSSRAIADAEYAEVQAAFASMASGASKRVEPVERNGQTLYRTAFTGLSREEAERFCTALKASGRSCFVR